MSARKQRVVWPQEGHAEAAERQGGPSGGDRRTGPAAAATAAAAQPASPGATYRIMCSSEDSFSDGELHVEWREGSVTAWYQHGTASRGGSPRKAPRGAGAGDDGDDEAAPLHGSLTVVLHDDAPASSGGSEAGAAAGQQQTNGTVSWETNNLYDYIRGLQQAGEAATGEMDSKEWARRIGALRQVLRERDGEVAELQRLLEERAGELEGRHAELAQQAQRVADLEQRIAELEQRIRQLVRQLEAAQAGSSSRELPSPSAHISFHSGEPGVSHATQKRRLRPAAAAFTPAQPDSYCVQLPAQSYAEHQGCGFWQSLWQSVPDSVQHHPRRWGAATAALLLLLLIVLCATLVPASRRRAQRPSFLEAPSVAGAGASWVDLSVRLDRPGMLSYMAFRQSDLNTQVPGLGRTLMELIQEEGVQARAVYAASASPYALHPDDAPQAALQSLAVACGWAPVPDASSDGSQPAARLSVLSASGGASAACAPTAAATPGRCARCPILETGTAYTLLLVAATPSGKALSGVQVVNAVTGDASVNLNALEPPFADNITERGFGLHVKLNVPGTLYYAVAHSQMYASYGASLLAFGQLSPPAAAVIGADPAAFTGGLVAAGSVAAAAAGEWVHAVVQPPCVGALCALSQWGLQGGTPYSIFLVAVDTFGTTDPAPAVLTVTTAPATAAPALLPGSQPANITDSGFGVAVSQDAAGGVYYMLLAAKPGVATSGGSVAPGSWGSASGLSPGGGTRRLTAAAGVPVLGNMVQQQLQGGARWQRQLLQDQAAPGSLVVPTCYPANRTCTQTAAAIFAGTAGLAGNFDVVASGCLPVPAAGQPLALPPFSGLQNNTLYHLMLSTEDTAVPQAHRLQPPAVFAVRTVDLSAPQLACGFPVATNITSTSFSLAAMLTKPGASAFYVVLPAGAAQAPSALDVLRGTAAGGASATAAGNMTQWGTLPWEAAGGGNADPRKLWAQVAGLQGGANYTAFVTVSVDGAAPVPGAPVAVLSGIITPTTVPPTFTRLEGINATVDEQRGTFSVQLSAGLDRPGQVYFALYRNYSCITGDPSVSDIVAGNSLPSGVCACADASYCARVSSGSFPAPAQGAVRAVGGDLSPLPFQSLANATDAQLKCFQGGLGQATDTYNIYVVASNALPTYTGLAPQCGNFAQAVAAAAAAAAGSDVDATCPAAPQLSCSQAQLRPDAQTLQSGAVVPWRSSVSSSVNASSTETWQPPTGVTTTGRPAKVQLSLEGGAPPAFTMGPVFTPALRTGSSFGLQFSLDKPALLIYAVFRPMPIDANGSPQAPVLIATGRVPVFDASTNATTGPITACPWAPGGPMQPQSQFFVNFVARDKYARMDGLCPGQQQGSATRVCADLAYTGG